MADLEYIVVDLDGTIATTKHRAHLLDKKPRDWEAYALACLDDPPIMPTIGLVRAWMGSDSHFGVMFVTGRSEVARKRTELWLKRQDLSGWSALSMRPHGDLRPNPELKVSVVEGLLSAGYRITMAIDDYPAVLEAYKDQFGITGLLPIGHTVDAGVLTGIAEGLAAAGPAGNLPPPVAEALATLRDTFARKNSDYARDTSWRSNFDSIADQMGFSAIKACDTLVAVKQARLQALTANGRDPANEAVEDTYLDRMVYATIAYALLLDERG